MVETNTCFINGLRVFICPWTGFSRPHRYGFPVYKEEKLVYVEGSYMTPGCALRDLERLYLAGKIGEKKAKHMARALAEYLDTETSAMMVKNGTLAEMMDSSGVPIPGHFTELRLFGGRLSEREWGVKYNDTESMAYGGFLEGEELLPPKYRVKGAVKPVKRVDPFLPKEMDAVAPPHAVWMEGKREKEVKGCGARLSKLLLPQSESCKRKRESEEVQSVKRPKVFIP